MSVLLLATAGCGEWYENEDEEGRLVPVSENVCASGMQWQGGNEESPLMHPGQDCVQCHSTGEGPSLGIAGTIYTNLHEPDDCAGVAGATIEIVDASDQVFTLTSNRAGNFYMSHAEASAIIKPYTASVTTAAGTRYMATAQSVGSCNSCHQSTGLNGAPGRIQAP